MTYLVDLLATGVNRELAEAAVRTYEQVKRSFILGHYVTTEVEAGHLAEAVTRIIQSQTSGTWTPIGQTVNMEAVFAGLESQKGKIDEALRMDLPRVLRAMYQIRNRRGAAHLGKFDANAMDSMYVVSACDWVMAELVRIFASLTPDVAHSIANSLVQRRIPLVEEFGNDLVVLDPKMRIREQIVVLLSRKEGEYVDETSLTKWIPNSSLATIQAELQILLQLRLVQQGQGYTITRSGIKVTEESMPIDTDLVVGTLSEFLNLKCARIFDDQTLVSGYWLHRKKGQQKFSRNDIVKLFKQCKVKPPARPEQCLTNNASRGLFDRVEKGLYIITPEGVLRAYSGFTS